MRLPCIICTILHTNESNMSQNKLSIIFYPSAIQAIKMTSTEDLEKRIKNLEKEVQHLKAALQYQTKNKKRRFD